ncbi:MAG TPA: T9SS type A sorting domain-containing protein [Flavipsychrobacter sp.]
MTQIDPNTGNVIKLDSIPGVKWIRIVNYAYDTDKKQYHFIGMNGDETEMAYYTIDATSGELSNKTVVDLPKDDNPANFAYNPNDGNMYGIYWNALREEEYFVRVNEETGTFDSVSFFPGIKWIEPNTQCINVHTNQYTFVGLDSIYRSRYCSVNITTGQVFQSDIITAYDSATILIMKYDGQSKKYYAVITSGYPWKTGIDEVNVATGESKRISGLPPFSSVGQTQYTYNDKDGVFYLSVSRDTSDYDWLYAISSTDGILEKITPLPLLPGNDNLICYEYDADIDKIIALHWENKTNHATARIKVYPNPAGEYLVIDLGRNYDNITVVVFDMMGKVVRKNRLHNTPGTQISTEGLASANYLFVVFDKNKAIARRKIFIRR